MRKHLLNIIGIIIAFVTMVFGLVFGLWQLDMIVSGPVWWGDASQGWSTPSRYADQAFQCFIWKTTVGTAYDTLFLLIFLSGLLPSILLFASLWFWDEEHIRKFKKALNLHVTE